MKMTLKEFSAKYIVLLQSENSKSVVNFTLNVKDRIKNTDYKKISKDINVPESQTKNHENQVRNHESETLRLSSEFHELCKDLLKICEVTDGDFFTVTIEPDGEITLEHSL